MSDKELHHDLNELKTLNTAGLLLHLSTKEDLYQAKSELRNDISRLDKKIDDSTAKLDRKIDVQISEVKSALRWANRFTITTLVGVIIGLVKLFWSHF